MSIPEPKYVETKKCKRCDGYGYVSDTPEVIGTEKKCPDCKGAGWK